jgi:hypothetical protein
MRSPGAAGQLSASWSAMSASACAAAFARAIANVVQITKTAVTTTMITRDPL